MLRILLCKEEGKEDKGDSNAILSIEDKGDSNAILSIKSPEE